MFNTTFNNISFILWLSILLVEETGVPGENHRPAASHWQTLSHNVVSSGDRHWLHIPYDHNQDHPIIFISILIVIPLHIFNAIMTMTAPLGNISRSVFYLFSGTQLKIVGKYIYIYTILNKANCGCIYLCSKEKVWIMIICDTLHIVQMLYQLT